MKNIWKNTNYLESNEDVKLRFPQINSKSQQMSSHQGFDLSLGKLVPTLNLLVSPDGWGQFLLQILTIRHPLLLREEIQSRLVISAFHLGEGFVETLHWNVIIRGVLVEEIFNFSLKFGQVNVVGSLVERWFLYREIFGDGNHRSDRLPEAEYHSPVENSPPSSSCCTGTPESAWPQSGTVPPWSHSVSDKPQCRMISGPV